MQAVAATAHHCKIDPAIVEKDYYITIFLERLSFRLPGLLFKGGTSISKCHKIIQRFSEDLDLTLVQDHVTQGQRKKIKTMIKEVCEELNLTLLNEANTRSRRDFNRYEIDYSPKLPAIAIRPVLLVETTFIVKSYPSETKTATSMIYDYFQSINRTELAEEYGLIPFSVLVQTIGRTLIDKIFALCDYYLTNRIPSHSRHIYGISKLLPLVSLDDNFTSLFRRVREDRKSGSSQCVSALDEYNIPQLLSEILDKEIYKTDYTDIAEKVLYEVYPYEKAIRSIQTLIDCGRLD